MGNRPVAEREGFEPSIRFWRILTFQASAFDHSATAPHALDGVGPSGTILLSQGAGAWQGGGMKRMAASAAALFAAIILAANATPMATTPPPAASPGAIIDAAPASDWVVIAPADLLVMELAGDARGPSTSSGLRRVVIQLMPPPFSQGWIGNIRKLAAAHWWDGLSINRVQDNYVVQWGDASEKKVLPTGLAVVSAEHYLESITGITVDGAESVTESPEFSYGSGRDAYSGEVGFVGGWPMAKAGEWIVAKRNKRGKVVKPEYYSAAQYGPVHCYAAVGVARSLPPDTGWGAELYTVIGHAPRHLDRNIAVIGRVIEGIEHLSSLPRGTGALGFYESEAERVPIRSVRLGNEIEADPLPAYEYLSTKSQSFARYADARANRREAFFVRPAGGADICNIPVPVRRVKAAR